MSAPGPPPSPGWPAAAGGPGWGPQPPPDPPGWHPDPTSGRRLRWWTGTGWGLATVPVPLPVPTWARRMLLVSPAVAVAAAVAGGATAALGRADRGGAYTACSTTGVDPLLSVGAALLAVALGASLASIGPVVRVLRGPAGRLKGLALVAAVVVPVTDLLAVVAVVASSFSYACLF